MTKEKNRCKCLEYGSYYASNSGLGRVEAKEEGKRVRECTYSMTRPCYCATCTNCLIHQERKE